MFNKNIIEFFEKHFSEDVSNIKVFYDESLDGTVVGEYAIGEEDCIRIKPCLDDMIQDMAIVHELVHLMQWTKNKGMVLNKINYYIHIASEELYNSYSESSEYENDPYEIDARIGEYLYIKEYMDIKEEHLKSLLDVLVLKKDSDISKYMFSFV